MRDEIPYTFRCSNRNREVHPQAASNRSASATHKCTSLRRRWLALFPKPFRISRAVRNQNDQCRDKYGALAPSTTFVNNKLVTKVFLTGLICLPWYCQSSQTPSGPHPRSWQYSAPSAWASQVHLGLPSANPTPTLLGPGCAAVMADGVLIMVSRPRQEQSGRGPGSRNLYLCNFKDWTNSWISELHLWERFCRTRC